MPPVTVHFQDDLRLDERVVDPGNKAAGGVVDRELSGGFGKAGLPQEQQNPMFEHALGLIGDPCRDEAAPKLARPVATAASTGSELTMKRTQLLRRHRPRRQQMADEALELARGDQVRHVLQGPDGARHRDSSPHGALARVKQPRPVDTDPALHRLITTEECYDMEVSSFPPQPAEETSVVAVQPHGRHRACGRIRGGQAGRKRILFERARARAPPIDAAADPFDLTCPAKAGQDLVATPRFTNGLLARHETKLARRDLHQATRG